jgi:hypothetical protein
MALVPVAIGIGIIGYAGAVAFYTLLGIWRLRRAALLKARLLERNLPVLDLNITATKARKPIAAFANPDPEPQAK